MVNLDEEKYVNLFLFLKKSKILKFCGIFYMYILKILIILIIVWWGRYYLYFYFIEINKFSGFIEYKLELWDFDLIGRLSLCLMF